MLEFAGAGEGLLDRNVVERILGEVRASCGPFHGGNGKADLLRRLNGYNQAARFTPWFVLVDLDKDADCAPTAIGRWLPIPADQMHFRVAVKAVEAWLLADAERLAKFLSVSKARVPPQPELLDDPKATVIELARRSKNRRIREDLVPRPGSGRKVGAAYTSRMVEFVSDTGSGWRPLAAAGSAVSLNRCLDHLARTIAATKS